MEHAACLRKIRCGCLATVLVATSATAAGTQGNGRMRPYQPLIERNRILLDTARLEGSPESRKLHPLPRSSAPATQPIRLAPGRDRGPVAGYTPRWEMLDFCPERWFYPDVRDCPAGWQRVRVDVGP